MANIVRCELPDTIKRYKPFTIEDYRDFLLVRNDLNNRTDEEQKILIKELAEEYFPDIPELWREYVFLKVFTSSIGKTKIPIVFECPICGKKTQRIMNIYQDPLKNPSLNITPNTKLNFVFPEKEVDNNSELFLNCINTVDHNNETYDWTDLSEETKADIINAVDYEDFENIIKSLTPINFELKINCCDKTYNIAYTDLTSIFMFLINPDEVFQFYEMNHILIKNKYTPDSIMKMLPIERSIALKLIEKESSNK